MKLSVITPSLNQAAYLAETLTSVRIAAEKVPEAEVEHWVIDGGSVDETLSLLQQQSSVRWISEPDRGQADAINKGWARATGDIFCYLCSDDLFEPETIRRVCEIFSSEPEVEVVYGDYYFLEGNSGWKRLKRAGEFSVARLLRGNFISQPATFWRRSLFDRYGGLDETLHYCLDHEYWLRICRDTRWKYLPEPLAVMRLHSDAKTYAALAPMWWESARMQRKYTNSLRPWVAALRMQLYGQHFYRFKRWWLERRGRGMHLKS